MIAHVSFLLLAWSATASAKTVEVDGFALNEKAYEHMVNRVSKPAQFDMSCEEVVLTVLSTAADKGMLSKYPSAVGVTGCGKKRVYVWVNSTGSWVANTESDESPPQPKPEPSEPVEQPAAGEK